MSDNNGKKPNRNTRTKEADIEIEIRELGENPDPSVLAMIFQKYGTAVMEENKEKD